MWGPPKHKNVNSLRKVASTILNSGSHFPLSLAAVLKTELASTLPTPGAALNNGLDQTVNDLLALPPCGNSFNSEPPGWGISQGALWAEAPM